jgi:hypothetical protein
VYVPVPTVLTAATETLIHVAAVPVTRPLTLVDAVKYGEPAVYAPDPAGIWVVEAIQGPELDPALSTYTL